LSHEQRYSMSGPLHFLEQQLLNNQHEIEAWFKLQWQKSPAPIYGSVDLRNSGFKLAPVDMNLFPGGFNNLNTDFLDHSISAVRAAITQTYPEAKKLLLIPENHTRNLFYWENIGVLFKILTQAGYDVKIGSLSPDYPTPTEIPLANHEKIILQTFTRDKDIINLGNFIPDIILLNNDLTAGIPAILQNVHQVIMPPAELGWSQRLKSGHFHHYAAVSDEFAQLLKIDPWLIAPLFRHCGDVDFMRHEGETCLVKNVTELFNAIEKKYEENNITEKPFVIVKADAGTYGMAVMTVRSAGELKTLNRKQRTQMSKSKGGQPVQRVIMQEGVYTFEKWGSLNSVAEPVVYMWGEQVVGGFYRVNEDQGIDENLNTHGMRFEPIAFNHNSPTTTTCQNRFYAYGVIARLSMLAAAREILFF
jgi:glutamate--cysteine ligase